MEGVAYAVVTSVATEAMERQCPIREAMNAEVAAGASQEHEEAVLSIQETVRTQAPGHRATITRTAMEALEATAPHTEAQVAEVAVVEATVVEAVAAEAIVVEAVAAVEASVVEEVHVPRAEEVTVVAASADAGIDLEDRIYCLTIKLQE